ncbi:MAG TPA: hypothetical protein VND93_02835 [Myxococcales bacterium]|jgi:hypothetical protein|nr:hypothetical protein [Myxococcales bacterium]
MNQYVRASMVAVLTEGVFLTVVLLSHHPLCGLLTIPFFTAMWEVGYCAWWLNDRLLCLEELETDKYAVGLLISVEPPEKKTDFDALDTDYSINLLLAKNPPGADRKAIEASTPFGYLVSERPSITAEGLPFTGEEPDDPIIGKKTWCLHAEFEGAGVMDAFYVSIAAALLAFAAVIACSVLPPPWGWIVGILLALLAWLLQYFGTRAAKYDRGSYSDVDPTLGALHPREEGGKLFDVLGVSGTWVYDSGHVNEGHGWNEIHPIKACHRVTQWDGVGDWPAVVDENIARFSAALEAATSPETTAAQQDPSHGWQLHPLVDGCAPPTSISGVVRWSAVDAVPHGPAPIKVEAGSSSAGVWKRVAVARLDAPERRGDEYFARYEITGVPLGAAVTVLVTRTDQLELVRFHASYDFDREHNVADPLTLTTAAPLQRDVDFIGVGHDIK